VHGDDATFRKHSLTTCCCYYKTALRVGASGLRRDAVVRDEEAEEGAYRQHTSTGARHERKDHHARLPLRLHRQVADIHLFRVNVVLTYLNIPASSSSFYLPK